ncbi:hypothetical protein [Lactiplantibacillus daowaiensis]|uniref:Transport protein n=1 Tax=Lactiplantibacillus daowaiensis TaxID=2559918 RepID=A0ABW1S408_9LACO
MTKYGVQVYLYTRYFFQVMLDNLGVLLYTIVLPLFFLVLNIHQALFKPLTMTQVVWHIMPFIAWMIFSNFLVAVSDIAMLREQGYLKQYATLVVNPTVFIVSKFLVSVAVLLVTLTLMGIGCSVLFQLPLWGLVWRLWVVLLLTSGPIMGYCLPLLSFAIRFKTLNAVVNVVTLVVMIGSAAIENQFQFAVNTIWLNLISPMYLVMNVFNGLLNGHLVAALPAYLVTLVVMFAIGMVSYRHCQLLPVEGI